MGIGDWGLGIGMGIGDWPNPQSPIPNPQYQILLIFNIDWLTYIKCIVSIQ